MILPQDYPLPFENRTAEDLVRDCSDSLSHHYHVRLLKTMTNSIVTTCKTMNEKLKLINIGAYIKHIGNKITIIIKKL